MNSSATAKQSAKKKPSPAEFIREVRREAKKVTWPTRKETLISSLMVVVLAVVASVFFLIIDWIAGNAVQFILGFGG
jgi:preprotein translocase subunit SecE